MKIRILLIISILTHVTLYGQTIDDIFKTMPADLLPGISENNKAFLLINKDTASVPYTFGEISKEEHGDTYIRIRTSDIGDTQIKLLPVANDSMIVSVVNTVCGGVDKKVCSSDISFYTTEWKKIDDESLFPKIDAESFINHEANGNIDLKYIISLIDIEPISIKYNDLSNNMVLTLNYKNYVSPDVLKQIEAIIKEDSITLKWDGKRFNL